MPLPAHKHRANQQHGLHPLMSGGLDIQKVRVLADVVQVRRQATVLVAVKHTMVRCLLLMGRCQENEELICMDKAEST